MSDVQMPNVRCLMSDVCCLLSDVWCLMSDIRCLMSKCLILRRLMPNAWCLCLMSDVICQRSDVRSPMSDVLSHVCSPMSDVWFLMLYFFMSDVRCLISYIWCPMSDVWVLISYDFLSNFSSDIYVQFFWSIFFVHFSAVLSVDSPPISSLCLASFFRPGY